MNEEMAPEQEPEQSAPPPPVPQPAPQPTPQPRVPFWGWEDVMLFFGLGIPCLFVVELAAALVAKTFHVPQADPFVLVSGQTAGYVVLFSLLAGILRAQYNAPFWRSMGWVRSSIRPLTALLLGPPLALSVALLGGVLRIPDVDSPMKKLLESPHGELALALFGVCVAPLAEELAFRGFLQPLLVRTLGTGAGIVLTALFFGLLHGPENGWSWGHVALISLAGAAFGAIRYFGSTRSSILAHAAYNGTLFAALFAQGRNPAI